MDHKQVAKVPFLCPLMCILWANIVDVKNPIAHRHAATSSCKMQLPLSPKKKKKKKSDPLIIVS